MSNKYKDMTRGNTVGVTAIQPSLFEKVFGKTNPALYVSFVLIIIFLIPATIFSWNKNPGASEFFDILKILTGVVIGAGVNAKLSS
jgi:uncharacterized membrane protein